MIFVYILFIVIVISLVTTFADESEDRLNIVLIIADDLGWDDVSFHGSDQIATPNIDLLAYTGIAFERYYSHCICTPSRTALLTGKFAHRTGMQGYPLTLSEDRGLPVTEKLLPQYLKELGYATHLVGKWHVGDSRTEYLAVKRGFDSYFGHKGGYRAHRGCTRNRCTNEVSRQRSTWNTGKVSGMGLYRNNIPAWDVEGYITDVYTAEAKSIIKLHDKSKPLFLTVAHNAPHSANDGALLQAPPEYVRAMRHIESPERRIYAAMVKKLDESVGDIIQSLSEKGILQKTVIVFISDNGGMTSGLAMNYASNWPLRGIKMAPFEGGVRVVGLLWTPTLLSNHIWKGYMHVVDWLPTLLRVAGSEPPPDIDGIDLWNQIITNQNTLRNEMYEIDDYTGFASITLGDHKLVTGVVNENYSDHQGHDLRGIIGNVSSYEQSIRSSKLYSVLDKIGKPFIIDDITKRKQIKVHCNNHENIDSNTCYPRKDKVCLFNIKEDPCERVDLSGLNPDLVKTLLERLQIEKGKMIQRTVPLYRDPRSAPKYFNYTWAAFADSF